jgi:DNA mismatch repair protein MutL
VQRLALAHEGTGFVVTHDQHRVFDVEPSMDLRARIRRAFGSELAEALEPVEARDGDLVLAASYAPPRFARSDAARQMWFLNGRVLRDKLLVRALKEGYRGFLFESRQPVAFLVLSMDPRASTSTCTRPRPSALPRREAPVRPDRRRRARRWRARISRRRRAARGHAPAARSASRRARPVERASRARALRRARVVGRTLAERACAAPEGVRGVRGVRGALLQIARTYIVRELEDGFEIVDQHALHERITYEALAAEQRAGSSKSSASWCPSWSSSRRTSWRWSRRSRPSWRASASSSSPSARRRWPFTPCRPASRAPRTELLVRDIVSLLEEARTPTRERLLEEVLQRAACRSSVMAGDALTQAEMQSLLERGAALESDQTCVHGRPTRVRFTLADLERAFLRRG